MEYVDPSVEIELRSQEVQEIINHMPSSLIRWGLTVLFCVTSLLFAVTWFIEYPDLLHAEVIITTSSPPAILVARETGNLFLLKHEKDSTRKGEVLGYIQTSIPLLAIHQLEDAMNGITSISIARNTGTFGEFETDYSAYLNASENLRLLDETQLYSMQIAQYKKQEATYLKVQKALRSQVLLAKEELDLAKQKFKIDSILHSQRVISQVDFNKEKSLWMQQQRLLNNTENALLDNEIQINQISKQISDLKIEEIEKSSQLKLALINSRRSLIAHIQKWKESYLLISPTNGTVAFIGTLEEGLFINEGRSLITVIPFNDSLIAKAELPIRNSGKVKIGQRVNIRLDNYPFEQFGNINGIVSTISLVPSDGKYSVSIRLPNGLKTNQGRVLPFKQQLSGSTEIITEELKLMERFFYQLKVALSRDN